MLKNFSAPAGMALWLASGAALGLVWSIWRVEPEQRRAQLDAGLWLIAGAVLGGRLWHVIIDWHYYQTQLTELPQLWLGGFSVSGALAGMSLVLVLLAWTGFNPDDLLPVLTTLTVALWLSCWPGAYLYGPETIAWWGVPVRDEWGVVAQRWPLQPAAALLTLVAAWGLDAGRAQGWIQSPGLAASLGVVCFALLLGAADSLRADTVPLWAGLSPDGWVALSLAILTILRALRIIIIREIGSI